MLNINIAIEEGLYLNSKSELKCKCLVCNNKWIGKWSSLYKLKCCPKCSIKNKCLTYEQIKSKLNDVNKNIELISSEYVNNYTNLSFRCLIDGHEWEANWGNVSRKPNCPKCSLEKMKKSKKGRTPYNKLSIKEIQKRLENLNENLNVVEFENKLKVNCFKCGYIWLTTWDSLSSNHKCKSCSGKCYSGLNEVKNILHNINPYLEIIDDCYKNNYSDISIKCNRCRDEWKTKFKNIKNNCKCKKCDAVNSRSSSLSEYLRDSLIDWKIKSMEACGYKCVVTGNRFDDIHHAVSLSTIIEEIFEILNIKYEKYTQSYTVNELEDIKDICLKLHSKYGLGYCVTKEIHKDFHIKYGYRRNTKEQFLEFIENIK